MSEFAACVRKNKRCTDRLSCVYNEALPPSISSSSEDLKCIISTTLFLSDSLFEVVLPARYKSLAKSIFTCPVYSIAAARSTFLRIITPISFPLDYFFSD